MTTLVPRPTYAQSLSPEEQANSESVKILHFLQIYLDSPLSDQRRFTYQDFCQFCLNSKPIKNLHARRKLLGPYTRNKAWYRRVSDNLAMLAFFMAAVDEETRIALWESLTEETLDQRYKDWCLSGVWRQDRTFLG